MAKTRTTRAPRAGSGRVGKMKKWRMTPKQIVDGKPVRYGRKLRNAMAMMDTTKAYATPLVISMMKAVGIATPIFDKTMLEAIEAQDVRAVAGDVNVTDEISSPLQVGV